MEHASKFTPGPWEVIRHQRASMTGESISVYSANGRIICDMGDYPNAEDTANAHLIAAAHDLLEICKLARELAINKPEVSGMIALAELTRQAIKKAESLVCK